MLSYSKYAAPDVGSVFGGWTVVGPPVLHFVLCEHVCGNCQHVPWMSLYGETNIVCAKCRIVQSGTQAGAAVAREEMRRRQERWQRKHAQRTGRLFSIAQRAFERCADASNSRYGGRGIRVMFASVEEFADYLLTLAGCNDTHLMLDRIDNDYHYCEGNLRFATPEESALNTRKQYASWLREFADSPHRVVMRALHANGWSHHRIALLYALSSSVVETLVEGVD